MMKDKLAARPRPDIYSTDALADDIATLSGGLISKTRVGIVLRADAGGSQSRSGQLPEGSGAPGVIQAQLPFGQDASASGAAVVGGVSQGPGAGQSTGGVGEGRQSRHAAAFEVTDNPMPLLDYLAFGDLAWSPLSEAPSPRVFEMTDNPSPQQPLGGAQIQVTQEQTTSGDDIEMTDDLGPQRPSPGVSGWDGIDAVDPARAAASGGPADGGGAGLVPVVGPDQSAPAVRLTTGEIEVLSYVAKGESNPTIGKRPGLSLAKVKKRISSAMRKLRVRSRQEAVDGARRRGLLPADNASASVSARSGVEPALSVVSVVSVDGSPLRALVGLLAVFGGVRPEVGRAGEPDGERLAAVAGLLQDRARKYLAAHVDGVPADVRRQRIYLDHVKDQARELQERDPAQVAQLLREGGVKRVTDARLLDSEVIGSRYETARADLGPRLAGEWLSEPQEQLDFLNEHDRGFSVEELSELSPESARKHLVGLWTSSGGPLSVQEVEAVLAAVDGWGSGSATAAERFLLPVVAHVAGMRITVEERTGEGPPRLVEEYGPSEGWPVTLLYDPANPGHYEAITSEATAEEVVRFRPVKGGLNLREMLAVRKLPAEIALPPEGQLAGQGWPLRDIWVDAWAGSLKDEFAPDGRPYSTRLVAGWSGHLINRKAVGDLWNAKADADRSQSRSGQPAEGSGAPDGRGVDAPSVVPVDGSPLRALVGLLADSGGVRPEVGRAGEPDGERLAAVAGLLQDRARKYLAAHVGRVPADVRRQRIYLDHVKDQARELQERDPARVAQLLRKGGVKRVTDARLLDSEVIRSRYETARADLGLVLVGEWLFEPQEQLDFLNKHDRGIAVEELSKLSPESARAHLVGLWTSSGGPLLAQEVVDVRAAIDGWGSGSATAAERFLLPVVAHVAGMRITVAERTGEGPPRVVEEYGPSEGWPVTLLYDPANPGHYEAITSEATAEEVVRFRPVKGGLNLREMLAVRKLPAEIALPPEGQTADRRTPLRDFWVDAWVGSLKGEFAPDGRPYSSRLVAEWSGHLIPKNRVGGLWKAGSGAPDVVQPPLTPGRGVGTANEVDLGGRAWPLEPQSDVEMIDVPDPANVAASEGSAVRDGAGAPVGPGQSAPARPLTPKQLEVLAYVAEGWPFTDIAEKLGVTPNEVKKRMSRVRKNLDASDLEDAVKKAHKRKLPLARITRGLDWDKDKKLPPLMPSELRVLSHAATGQDDGTIAAQLRMDPTTVTRRLNSAMAKLGVDSLKEAVDKARLLYLLPGVPVDIDAELWRPKPGEDPSGGKGGPGRLFGELVAVRYTLIPGLKEWTILRRIYVKADPGV
ncbi:LuxR C-terminal-related transcriptional regulator, partial [Micromonospora sp. NPDC048830]|uniref:response regulator transcription factor n=1 Tax=Micromonospora sp. NPDC048830 TaxID=3364257 RepID=UPI003722CA4A